ncbi:hypothetical protein BLA17378_00385 [Burkholderia aenigmatica]|uniref:Uncharacterized protein n=1 Tax=Burkholderia aenigmatica TaxID=2015348 RepID=A0ABY6XIT8_9BURK|nr:hypothetical protein BLA17378_00385 [Burkholderia aenigmatica]VWD58770.1 hypothetical protein BLA18628_06941 [Burkholderia aenigmatica]
MLPDRRGSRASWIALFYAVVLAPVGIDGPSRPRAGLALAARRAWLGAPGWAPPAKFTRLW